MVMDMDVLVDSPPISRTASPPSAPSNGVIQEEVEETVVDEPVPANLEEKAQTPIEEKPKKMGNLMKELKQDVTQGAMEFNMDSFF